MTKREKIEEYIISNGSITSLEAINVCVYTRLAALISKLKQAGWVFKTESMDHKSGCSFAKYNLVSLPPTYYDTL
jgi:hypothetical protein